MTIARPFAVGRHAVTRGQFAAFVNNTGYKTEGGAYVWAATNGRATLKRRGAIRGSLRMTATRWCA